MTKNINNMIPNVSENEDKTSININLDNEPQPSTSNVNISRRLNLNYDKESTSNKKIESMAQNFNCKLRKYIMEIKNPAPVDIVNVSDKDAIKHPLERPWSIWFNSNDKPNWEDCLVKLTTFDTVEDYWCLFHHMKLPSELRVGQDYAVFKHGIRPAWEDVSNSKGGRWLIMLDYQDLDSIWLDIVLLLIGENFHNMDLITGVIVNVRAKSKVVIWTTNKSKDDNCMIAHKVKKALGIHKKFNFQAHNSSKIMFTF
ncbi:eukaryotic translation initiation factor 4E-like [Aphomia sociella]